MEVNVAIIAERHSLIDASGGTQRRRIGNARAATVTNNDIVSDVQGNIFAGSHLNGNLGGVNSGVIAFQSGDGHNRRGT